MNRQRLERANELLKAQWLDPERDFNENQVAAFGSLSRNYPWLIDSATLQDTRLSALRNNGIDPAIAAQDDIERTRRQRFEVLAIRKHIESVRNGLNSHSRIVYRDPR